MNNTAAYTPLESLFLFQLLPKYGFINGAFNRISDELKSTPLIQEQDTYDAARLSPESLQELALQLLREEQRGEADNAADKSWAGLSPTSRKRKLQSPPLPSLEEAHKYSEKLPILVDRLYARFRDNIVRQIRDDERRIEIVRREISEIERGEWDTKNERQPETQDGPKAASPPTPAHGDSSAVKTNGQTAPALPPASVPASAPATVSAPASAPPRVLDHGSKPEPTRTPTPVSVSTPTPLSHPPVDRRPSQPSQSPVPPAARTPNEIQQSAIDRRTQELPRPLNGTTPVLQHPQGVQGYGARPASTPPQPLHTEPLQRPDNPAQTRSPAQGQTPALKWEPPYQPGAHHQASVPSPRPPYSAGPGRAPSYPPPSPSHPPPQYPNGRQTPTQYPQPSRPTSQPQAKPSPPVLVPPQTTSQLPPSLPSLPLHATPDGAGQQNSQHRPPSLPPGPKPGVPSPSYAHTQPKPVATQPPIRPPSVISSPVAQSHATTPKAPVSSGPWHSPSNTPRTPYSQHTQHVSASHPPVPVQSQQTYQQQVPQQQQQQQQHQQPHHQQQYPQQQQYQQKYQQQQPPPPPPPQPQLQQPPHQLPHQPQQQPPQQPPQQPQPPSQPQHQYQQPNQQQSAPASYPSSYSAATSPSVAGPEPRPQPPVAQTPVTTQQAVRPVSTPQPLGVNVSSHVIRGHGTKWVSTPTPATPRVREASSYFDVESPAYEPLSPPLQPAQQAKSSPIQAGKNDVSKVGTAAHAKPRQPRSAEKAGAEGAATPAPEFSANKIKHEEATPRVSEDGGDTTADEGSRSRVQSATATANKRKREESPIDREPSGPPTHVLWTRSFNKVSASALEQVISHRHANMFAHAVKEREAPGYRNIVLQPQDLNNIRRAINQGHKAATAAAAALPDVDPSAGSIWLPMSVELVPPRGIINIAQLEREIVHMFANAIMYAPDPNRGFGPSFLREQEDGSEDENDDALGYEVDEDAIVKDTRSMFVEVEKLLSDLRNEVARNAPPPVGGLSSRSMSLMGGEASAAEDETDELAGDAKRRRVRG